MNEYIFTKNAQNNHFSVLFGNMNMCDTLVTWEELSLFSDSKDICHLKYSEICLNSTLWELTQLELANYMSKAHTPINYLSLRIMVMKCK